MYTIQISVRDKIATQTDGTVIINGNSDYSIEFDFDAEWTDLNNKIGIFAYNDAAAHKWAYQTVMFSGNTCAVPILRDIHCVYVGVTAGNVRVTTPAKVQCRLSISDYADTEEPPSADIWGQILAKLDELQTEIDEIKAGGGGGGTPDWAQNDPNGAGYIKNRCGGYDYVQTKESELLSLNCPADKNSATTFAPPSFFTPSAGDIISVTVDGSTKEYTMAEETINGNSVLWFGTQNPSSITDFNAFFASDKWFGDFEIHESGIAIAVAYGSLSEIAGKTVGLKQRRLSVTPVKINRRYLDVDETAIKITEKGAIYSPSITDDGSSLGEYAVNLGQGKGGSTGAYSFTAGQNTSAGGDYASSFGTQTTASGVGSAAFGDRTTASGDRSAAFGDRTIALKQGSFTSGYQNVSNGDYASSFGSGTNASGTSSAAFGRGTNASGEFSAAFGNGSKASGSCSAAFGQLSLATKESQFVCGQFNDETNDRNCIFVVGSGSSYSAKKNGFAVTVNGEIVMPDPNATSTTYMKARFNSDGTITLIPLADETKSYTTECTTNRTTSITAESTNAQYPTAKAVYDAIQAAIANLNNTGE